MAQWRKKEKDETYSEEEIEARLKEELPDIFEYLNSVEVLFSFVGFLQKRYVFVKLMSISFFSCQAFH